MSVLVQCSFSHMNIVAGRYRYMQDLLLLGANQAPTPPLFWPRCPTPINVDLLISYLSSHPDQTFASYIYTGLSNGFHIGFDRSSTRLQSASRNHPSSLANPSVVENHIATEVSAGRLVGPVAGPLTPLVHVSPLGLVPKSHQFDRWRMIVDLSFPHGNSVNDGIPPELCSLAYASVDDAVEHILQLGRSTQLVKLDLKDAYRMVPVHPHDQSLLGISWQGRTYVDRALLFGLRSAPKLFSAVADAIAWVLHCQGVRYQLHYLDDFLFLGAPATSEATATLSLVTNVFQHLGIPVATHKTEGPATCVTFLGILIDTQAYELRLPSDKLNRLQALLDRWLPRRSCTKKDLESLIGHLSHAATVVRPGRTFLRQFFTLLNTVNAPHHFIHLNASARADLLWWKCFLQDWNGTSLLPLPSPSVHVYSDASGSWGCGTLVQGTGWFQLRWPPEWSLIDISVKELVPVVLSATLWGHSWRGLHVRFHSDNMAVVDILRRRSGRDPSVLHLMRCFFFYLAHFNFQHSAEHVPGVLNTAADAISRNNLPHLSSLLPQTPQTRIPQSLVDLLVKQTPNWGFRAWIELFQRSLLEVSPQPPSPHIGQVNAAT